jgi:hypothetical protein
MEVIYFGHFHFQSKRSLYLLPSLVLYYSCTAHEVIKKSDLDNEIIATDISGIAAGVGAVAAGVKVTRHHFPF